LKKIRRPEDQKTRKEEEEKKKKKTRRKRKKKKEKEKRKRKLALLLDLVLELVLGLDERSHGLLQGLLDLGPHLVGGLVQSLDTKSHI